MEKITSFTEKQKEQMVEWREKWLKIGLDTHHRGDRKKAEPCMRAAYKAADLPEPKKIIWYKSPMRGCEEVAKLEGKDPSEQLYACGYGSHDASWLAYYDFFHKVMKIEGVEKLQPLIDLALYSGWYWPYDELCVMTDKPTSLHLDKEGRLHCENDAAIKYGDGWGVYVWHGIRIHEDLILKPATITPDAILEETNLEIRRIMLEIYGAEKYIVDSGAKEIHQDKFGILYAAEIPDDETITMVRVIDATDKDEIYFLRVPPGMETAHQAVAWTFSETPETYNPVMET